MIYDIYSSHLIVILIINMILLSCITYSLSPASKTVNASTNRTQGDDFLSVLWSQQQIIDNIMNIRSNISDKAIHEMKSASMLPLISLDSYVLLDLDIKTKQFHEIGIGDIIAFRAPDPAQETKTIVHRVSAIIDNGNNLTGNVILCAPIPINDIIQNKTILTKGDSNECSIPGIDFPVTIGNYIGRALMTFKTLH